MGRLLFLIIALAATSFTANAHDRDYKNYKDSSARLSCTPVDTTVVLQAIHRLETLDTNSFSKNLHTYYSDLGWAYYRRYCHTKDTAYL